MFSLHSMKIIHKRFLNRGHEPHFSLFDAIWTRIWQSRSRHNEAYATFLATLVHQIRSIDQTRRI